jgi:hypothetical protein
VLEEACRDLRVHGRDCPAGEPVGAEAHKQLRGTSIEMGMAMAAFFKLYG